VSLNHDRAKQFGAFLNANRSLAEYPGITEL
jgi:hypothetical protein